MENGGFAQFFHHDSGARAADTVESLERIRAVRAAALLQDVINLFPGGEVPEDEDDRTDAFDQIATEMGDEIAAFDDRFYDSGESIVELTISYVSKNIKSFSS